MVKPAPGYLCMVLHAHLPFVRHPEYEDALEERWLFEAMTEVYLPLVELLEAWERDQIQYQLTLSISPPLMTMLGDPLLQQRYQEQLDRLIELADAEEVRTRTQPEFHRTARHYQEQFRKCRQTWRELCGGDLLATFDRHAASGNLELITSSATHGFLPLMQHQPRLVDVQLKLGRMEFARRFGRPPQGLWNAECGYYPGLEALMADAGFLYTFLDSHGLLHARPRPRFGVRAPINCDGKLAGFGRDPEASRAVWSAEIGYPGDPNYREFYRDIGFDLDQDYLAPYIHESGLRTATGIKYHRVTGSVDLADKAPYHPQVAADRTREHALDFLKKREYQFARDREAMEAMDRPPLVVAPYDAELFGHWWYEGPLFLDHLMRAMHYGESALKPITPGRYLERHPELESVNAAFSSWGEGGYAGVWLNEENAWIYPELDRAGDRMQAMARRHTGMSVALIRRALNQMARELLLAQSSDWPFILKMGTTAEYAQKRIKTHLENLESLHRQIIEEQIDESALSQLETRHNIFPALEYEIFC